MEFKTVGSKVLRSAVQHVVAVSLSSNNDPIAIPATPTVDAAAVYASDAHAASASAAEAALKPIADSLLQPPVSAANWAQAAGQVNALLTGQFANDPATGALLKSTFLARYPQPTSAFLATTGGKAVAAGGALSVLGAAALVLRSMRP